MEDKCKIRPCVDFLITENCNYRCEYCSQSKAFCVKKLKEADDETIEAFLRFIKTLDKDFEITLSGGEPLTHPRFFDVVKAVSSCGLKLSVVSNFSFPLESYQKIIDIMGENFVELFVSFHSTQVKDLNDFLKKAQSFDSSKCINTKFSIASVLTDENVETLTSVAARLDNLGIEFNLQHMRIKNSYVIYNKEAQDFLRSRQTKEPGETIISFGKMCYAGSKFLLIYPNGNAYRCYSSRFNKKHILGNLKDKKFKIWSEPYPCLNKQCTCPKPISRNMLDTSRKDKPRAFFATLFNAVFLPILVVKNIDILSAKLKQGARFKK